MLANKVFALITFHTYFFFLTFQSTHSSYINFTLCWRFLKIRNQINVSFDHTFIDLFSFQSHAFEYLGCLILPLVYIISFRGTVFSAGYFKLGVLVDLCLCRNKSEVRKKYYDLGKTVSWYHTVYLEVWVGPINEFSLEPGLNKKQCPYHSLYFVYI